MKTTKQSMVQSIISKAGIQKQLLLTGTPSEFVKENIKSIFISFEEIMSTGMVSNFRVELATSTYNFKKEDFNSDSELNANTNFNVFETNASLDSVLAKIMLRLKSNLSWNETFENIGKTMIACRNRKQAEQVYNYFNEKGVSSFLSISGDSDCVDIYGDDVTTDANVIQDFKEGKDGYKLLIVVRRGVLGYNDTKLYNIIDMTCSRNVNRVFQLMGRITRKDDVNPTAEKVFIKVVPFQADTQYKYFMTIVICLFKRDFFIQFDGNYKQLYIPVIRKRGVKRVKRGVSVKASDVEPMDFMAGISVNNELFNDIDFNKNSEYSTYAYTTYEQIERFLNGLLPMPTCYNDVLEFCKENNIKRISDLQKAWPTAYRFINENTINDSK